MLRSIILYDGTMVQPGVSRPRFHPDGDGWVEEQGGARATARKSTLEGSSTAAPSHPARSALKTP
jgi:hypothetical protein